MTNTITQPIKVTLHNDDYCIVVMRANGDPTDRDDVFQRFAHSNMYNALTRAENWAAAEGYKVIK